MKAINHKHTTDVLKAAPGTEDKVYDLPICRTYDSLGNELVISVWELTDEDIEALIKNRKIYFQCWGHTHPPIVLSANSLFGDGS